MVYSTRTGLETLDSSPNIQIQIQAKEQGFFFPHSLISFSFPSDLTKDRLTLFFLFEGKSVTRRSCHFIPTHTNILLYRLLYRHIPVPLVL